MAVDELSVLEPLPPDANGAGGEQNHLIPLEIKLLHLKQFHIFIGQQLTEWFFTGLESSLVRKFSYLLAEGSEPAHGQSAILPGDNSSADLDARESD